MNINIGIVGASIAGIACSVVLKRLGFNITVFEKSDKVSYQRGAGIMMPMALIKSLKQYGLVNDNLKYFEMNEFTTFVKKPDGSQEILTTTGYHDSVTVHWANLYAALEEKFDKNSCLFNKAVIKVNKHDNYVELVLDSGEKHFFDYVFFADGYNSLGRATLFPDLKPEYANYIAWRGLVDESQIDSINILGYKYNKEYYRYLYENGHLLLFPVHKGNSNSNEYLINWVLYENLATSNLPEAMKVELVKNNIPPGHMSKFFLDHLYNLAEQYLPKFPQSLIHNTAQPFTQVISDILLPQYVMNRVCFIGDASTLLRPHVGSNATKALQDTLALGTYLEEELKESQPYINKALEKWNESQTERASHLFPLARSLGQLLVTDVPELQTLNKHKMDELWNKTIEKYRWYGNKNSKSF